MGFKDHFSKQARLYAQFRPSYPEEMFKFLSSLTSDHDLVLDCATGNGQAARGLKPYFEKIVATDASKDQIDCAPAQPGIEYVVSGAESCPFIEAGTVDLVTVGCGVHWFDLDRFYTEVKRVLKPEGAISVWCYTELIGDEPSKVIKKYFNIVEPYFPKEVQNMVFKDRYRSLPFPFEEIPCPKFIMSNEMTYDQLVGFLLTTSGTQAYIKATNKNPVDLIKDELKKFFPTPDSKIVKKWEVHMKCGKIRG